MGCQHDRHMRQSDYILYSAGHYWPSHRCCYPGNATPIDLEIEYGLEEEVGRFEHVLCWHFVRHLNVISKEKDLLYSV